MAFAFSFFSMERLAIVMPTFSASSVTLIFRFANMTSMLIMIAILVSNTFAKIEVARTRLLSYRWVSCKHPQRRDDKSLCWTL